MEGRSTRVNCLHRFQTLTSGSYRLCLFGYHSHHTTLRQTIPLGEWGLEIYPLYQYNWLPGESLHWCWYVCTDEPERYAGWNLTPGRITHAGPDLALCLVPFLRPVRDCPGLVDEKGPAKERCGLFPFFLFLSFSLSFQFFLVIFFVLPRVSTDTSPFHNCLRWLILTNDFGCRWAVKH